MTTTIRRYIPAHGHALVVVNIEDPSNSFTSDAPVDWTTWLPQRPEFALVAGHLGDVWSIWQEDWEPRHYVLARSDRTGQVLQLLGSIEEGVDGDVDLVFREDAPPSLVKRQGSP